MNDQFSNWLFSNDTAPCCLQGRGWNYLLIRVEKNADFEYLFYQTLYDTEGLVRDENFNYAGIYCQKDGLLYDACQDLIRIVENPESLKARTAGALQEQLIAAVRERVEAVINNDRRNLQVTKLTDGCLLNQLEYTYKYDAAQTARSLYLAGEQLSVFFCYYKPDSWTEDSLLSYIADPEGYVQKQAEDYIAKNQENMLFDFLRNEAILKEYRAILADTENSLHLVKKISAAMAATSAKTVNVTIRKNETEFIFKTEASSLRGDCGSYYNSWNIVAADRRKFEELFGRSANYTPEEIVRITYAKKSLYEAEKR